MAWTETRIPMNEVKDETKMADDSQEIGYPGWKSGQRRKKR